MVEEETVDKILKSFGAKAVMSLTPVEIDEFREIDAMKQAYFLQSLGLQSYAQTITKREQEAFVKIYERLNLDKTLSFQANWRTGKLELHI